MIIELEPDLAARLKEEAARRGIDPKTLVRKALEDRWPPASKQYGHLQRTLSPGEWASHFGRWAENLSWPGLPPEAYDRESFYEDR